MKTIGIDIGTTTISAVVMETEGRKLLASRTIPNGSFIQTDECEYVRESHYGNSSAVIDIDINKAIAEMRSVK